MPLYERPLSWEEEQNAMYEAIATKTRGTTPTVRLDAVRAIVARAFPQPGDPSWSHSPDIGGHSGNRFTLRRLFDTDCVVLGFADFSDGAIMSNAPSCLLERAQLERLRDACTKLLAELP